MEEKLNEYLISDLSKIVGEYAKDGLTLVVNGSSFVVEYVNPVKIEVDWAMALRL